MKPIPIALVLTLSCLLAHRTHGSELTARLIVQHEQNSHNVGVYRDQQTNSTTASALTLADSTANSFGDTTARYGNLRVSLDASAIGTDNGNIDSVWGRTDPTCAWSDAFTINSAALNGTTGYFKPSLRYITSLQGTAASGGGGALCYTVASLTVTLGSQTYYLYSESDVDGSKQPKGTLALNVDAGQLAASNSLPNMDVQFTFGQPIAITANLYAIGYGGGLGRSEEIGYARLTWLGGHVYDANSNEVTNFTTSSESGTSWVAAQSSGAPPPKINAAIISSGTDVMINGIGGVFGDPVVLLTSTNVTVPMMNWVHLETNYFDFSGNVSFTNAVNNGEPQRYYGFMSQE